MRWLSGQLRPESPAAAWALMEKSSTSARRRQGRRRQWSSHSRRRQATQWARKWECWWSSRGSGNSLFQRRSRGCSRWSPHTGRTGRWPGRPQSCHLQAAPTSHSLHAQHNNHEAILQHRSHQLQEEDDHEDQCRWGGHHLQEALLTLGHWDTSTRKSGLSG